MTSKTRSLRDFRNPIGCLILLAAFAAAAGCSTAETPGGSATNVNHILPSGSSVAGWLATPSGGTHASTATLDYIAANGSSGCTECHGSDLKGGISKVSCFTPASGCHHGPVPGWVTFVPGAPQQHGISAKKAPGSSGFASCQICHGSDFSGGGANIPCSSCHGPPHPDSWRRGSGATTYLHNTTDAANAPVCAQCHRNNNLNPVPSLNPTPAPAGTPPGCFNNTLCHGAVAAPHALGSTWVNPTSSQFHGLTAKQDLSYCQDCHGVPGTIQFNGGSAPTSCQAACHTEAKAHPIRWYQAPQPFPNYVSSHRDSGNRGVACAICHKVDSAGAGPDPNAPSCFSASFNGVSCHVGGPGGPNHLVPFLGAPHTTTDQASYDADCANCHSITGVPPNSSAPTCVTCHQAASPLATPPGTCTSCHARPPDNPSTTAYPNFAGKHLKHNALAGVTGVCGTCHNGLDSGSGGHYDRANARPGKNALRVEPGDVRFVPTTYNGNADNASFSNTALTCANVSCHGAVTAPSWQTGTIAVNTEAGCRACHKLGTAAGTPENNSPFSGLHTFHLSTTVGGTILCVECHDMANATSGATNHFRFLNTPQMEGPASQTVEPNGSAANYNATAQSCGTFTCHTVTHSAFPWSGGANHPVPPARFTGTGHTSVTSETFPGTCGACHLETGTATKIGPTCTECHQAGSPLATPPGTCTSCHASPPSNPLTTAYPNVAGAHGAHLDLNTPSNPSGTPVTCDTCHSGLGTTTNAHYDRANARTGTLRVSPGDVVFLATYNAQSGASSFLSSAFTCGNVSCHGGTTPNWRTGTIDPLADCTICHKSATTSPPQYNDYRETPFPHTGKSQHRVACNTCHDTALLTSLRHFGELSNTTFPPGAAAQTIRSTLSYNPATPLTQGSCSFPNGVCHND